MIMDENISFACCESLTQLRILLPRDNSAHNNTILLPFLPIYYLTRTPTLTILKHIDLTLHTP